jgi:hypothetical protein
VNCAERLLEDPEFRGAARAVVADADQAFADVLPDGQPDPGQIEIAFVVLTRSDRDTPADVAVRQRGDLTFSRHATKGARYKVTATAVREPAG